MSAVDGGRREKVDTLMDKANGRSPITRTSDAMNNLWFREREGYLS